MSSTGSKTPPPLPLVPAGPGRPRLTARELADLRRAKSLLEYPGLTARLANRLGRPIERGINMLPEAASKTIHQASKTALFNALDLAVKSLGGTRRKRSSETLHKMLVGASGGVGGVFGLAALPVELPVSTTIMLRSIADIARSEHHDVSRVDIKLSCLEVFAFGGKVNLDDGSETNYWAVRTALAKAVTEAATYLAQKGIMNHTAPALVRLIGAIASRFGIVVSEQVAAKAIPVVGAAGGSMVNMLFIDHFQDMARGHFIVKRLEHRHGRNLIEDLYESLAV